MPALGVRISIILVLLIAAFSGGGYLMWGQVQDARESAREANDKAVEVGKLLDETIKRQAALDALLAARKQSDSAMSAQLKKLRSDLEGVMKDDPESATWAPNCVPTAVAERLRLPPDKDCVQPGASP